MEITSRSDHHADTLRSEVHFFLGFGQSEMPPVGRRPFRALGEFLVTSRCALSRSHLRPEPAHCHSLKGFRVPAFALHGGASSWDLNVNGHGVAWEALHKGLRTTVLARLQAKCGSRLDIANAGFAGLPAVRYDCRAAWAQYIAPAIVSRIFAVAPQVVLSPRTEALTALCKPESRNPKWHGALMREIWCDWWLSLQKDLPKRNQVLSSYRGRRRCFVLVQSFAGNVLRALCCAGGPKAKLSFKMRWMVSVAFKNFPLRWWTPVSKRHRTRCRVATSCRGAISVEWKGVQGARLETV